MHDPRYEEDQYKEAGNDGYDSVCGVVAQQEHPILTGRHQLGLLLPGREHLAGLQLASPRPA